MKSEEMAAEELAIEERAEQASDAVISFRRPAQKRGVKKFEAILDSAHELIVTQGVNNFSHYDLAEHAGVAAGSVYHFFPEMEAVYAALVERYDAQFQRIVTGYSPSEGIESWREIIWEHMELSRHYINANEQLLIMLLGPGQTWQTRQVDTVGDTAIARGMLENIEQYFEVPTSPDPVELLHLAIRILESIWQLSYQRHGLVTEAFQQETYRAVCAYLELYWPRYLASKIPAPGNGGSPE